jgi:glycosyltransferase involved in cell wall biosynthesis
VGGRDGDLSAEAPAEAATPRDAAPVDPQPPRNRIGTADFSVLMPVYWADQPIDVEEAFRSVTDHQELAPAQVVVVRDGPVGPALTDVLAALARRRGVSLVTLPANRGLAGALNAGLAACRFDVVARQDADDLSAPTRFSCQVPLVQSGELDLVGSAMREFSTGSVGPAGSAAARSAVAAKAIGGVGPVGAVTYGRIRSYPLTEPEIRRTAKLINPFAHPTVVTRRSLILAAGGYRNFFHLEDYDLWVRMLQAGVKAANLPDPLVDYRVSPAARRRRGGLKTLRAEVALQREFLDSGFINRAEWLRDLLLRGGLELAPAPILSLALRHLL